MPNYNRYLLVVIILIISTKNVFSQKKIIKNQVNEYIKTMNGFTVHKDIYFTTGGPINGVLSSNTADVKYQISFKQLITRNTLPWDTYLFATYSQKAFWKIYKESSPFEEINFNPSIGLGKAMYNKNDELVGIASFAMEHESNGRDSISSRSWNNFHLKYNTNIGTKTRFGIKTWIPFKHKEGNPDLLDYIGLGELTLNHKFIKDKLQFEVMVRKGLASNWNGAVRSRLFFNPFKASNQYLMLEWFNGYAESLLNYTQHTNMIRIGYVIKTSEFKFLN